MVLSFAFAKQDEAIKEHATRLEAAEHASRQLARKQETFLRERIESVS